MKAEIPPFEYAGDVLERSKEREPSGGAISRSDASGEVYFGVFDEYEQHGSEGRVGHFKGDV